MEDITAGKAVALAKAADTVFKAGRAVTTAKDTAGTAAGHTAEIMVSIVGMAGITARGMAGIDRAVEAITTSAEDTGASTGDTVDTMAEDLAGRIVGSVTNTVGMVANAVIEASATAVRAVLAAAVGRAAGADGVAGVAVGEAEDITVSIADMAGNVVVASAGMDVVIMVCVTMVAGVAIVDTAAEDMDGKAVVHAALKGSSVMVSIHHNFQDSSATDFLAHPGSAAEWDRVRGADFIAPWAIRSLQGVRVRVGAALVGMAPSLAVQDEADRAGAGLGQIAAPKDAALKVVVPNVAAVLTAQGREQVGVLARNIARGQAFPPPKLSSNGSTLMAMAR